MLCCSSQDAGTDKSVFPLPEPQDFFLAAQVKFDDLLKDMRKLKRDLTGMRLEWWNCFFSVLSRKKSFKRFIHIKAPAKTSFDVPLMPYLNLLLLFFPLCFCDVEKYESARNKT